MNSKFCALALSSLIILSAASQAQAQQSCDRSFRNLFGLLANTQADWRAGTTNRSDDAVVLSKDSEQILKEYRDTVNEAVYTDSSTMPIEIELQRGANFKVLRQSAGYGSGIFPKYAIEGIKNGKVGIVLGLPVSGHTGAENAARWAKTDLYNVRIEKEVNGTFVTERLINKQQSLEATTFHELQLNMEQGVNYKISYWRDGSAGPSGYREGRYIELVWNGN